MTHVGETTAPATTGLVLRRTARFYDLMAWLFLYGREEDFREKVIDLAGIQPGESVLDVGCGTGTLAIAAKRRTGPGGPVHGIDASPEMIDRARRKATKAKLHIVFRNEVVEALPFGDASFDAVFSTLMLHHLPPKTREQCAREMRRVLKPGGRMVAVDFAKPEERRKGLLSHLHRRHGHVNLPDLLAMLERTGLTVIDSGELGVGDLQFVRASAGGLR